MTAAPLSGRTLSERNTDRPEEARHGPLKAHNHHHHQQVGPAGASTLDELQQRLQELQRQRQLLKRPELRERPDMRPTSSKPQRPRSAAVEQRAERASAAAGMQPVRMPNVRRPSAPGTSQREKEYGAVEQQQPQHPGGGVAPGPAPAHATAAHATGSRPQTAAPAVPDQSTRPPSARPPSARPLTSNRQQPPPSYRRATTGGGFGPACPPLFSVSSTPRLDVRADHHSRAEAEAEKSARTALLRRLIREGYARLGRPAPTITPGTALEPLLYIQEKVLGKGAFGLVSLARSVVTGELVAMKTVDKAKLTSENLKKTVEHEIRILKKLRHKRIVKLYEVIETSRNIHLIMEYVDGGTVQQLVKKHKKLEESDAQRVLYQLVDAVSHCHANHVCHRDLKLENFMLGRSGRALKLIDFGLSVVWKPGQNLFKSYGTPCYMAPEIVRGNSYSGAQVDVWSLGVALATMLTGSLPFQGAGDTELKKRILRGAFPVPEHLSADARDLLKQMLALTPDQRIDLNAIKLHPWLKPYADAHGSSPSSQPRSGATTAAGEALDETVMSRLTEVGLEVADVERAVRGNTFSHEAACYEMLYTAAESERTSRLSARTSEGGGGGGGGGEGGGSARGLGSFFPFNLA